MENTVTLFAQGETYRIRVAVRGQTAATLRVANVASRLQLVVRGTGALLSRRCTYARPTCSQRKALRKRPV